MPILLDRPIEALRPPQRERGSTLRIALGKQWTGVRVRTIYRGAVLVVSQDDRDVLLPVTHLRKLTTRLQKLAKKSRG